MLNDPKIPISLREIWNVEPAMFRFLINSENFHNTEDFPLPQYLIFCDFNDNNKIYMVFEKVSCIWNPCIYNVNCIC